MSAIPPDIGVRIRAAIMVILMRRDPPPGGSMHPTNDTPLVIAGREFSSRLFMGTGKFPSNESMVAAWEAGRTEMVTVAIRRIDLSPDRPEKNFADYLDGDKYQ